jgi:hypothetical protein
LIAANIFVYSRTRTNGYVARFFVIPLPLSSSYCRLRSSTFPVPQFLYGITASSPVKTLVGPHLKLQNQSLHPPVNHQCKINSMERTMQHPPLIRVEQRLDTYRREHRKVQLPYVCLPLECSKLMPRVADFRLNIQTIDLIERYVTIFWTQIVQFL